MKKTLLTITLAIAMSGAALAAGQARSNVGCGLGTMLWANNADGSVLFQAFQATTNGTSGTQTFGITSGTSDCVKPGSWVQNEKLIEFVRANMDNLARDIAQGKGETLATFDEMLG